MGSNPQVFEQSGSRVRMSAEAFGAHQTRMAEEAASELKRSTSRGAIISLASQGTNFVLRTGSVMVLARLLTPKDFGLVGMAVAATGILNMIKDAGLGWAMVQRSGVTKAQASTLFWINFSLGAALMALCAILSPAIAAFYAAPDLLWINITLGAIFLFNGVGAQHRAMLQRNMNFGVLAIIDISSLLLSIGLAVAMAATGQRYWALVAMTVSQSGLTAAGAWLATRWIPMLPQWQAGVRSMLMFGGTITLSNVVSYLAFNTDKILLGRFWGAEALGFYGRAYSLSNVANENLNSAIAAVAFPALSRLQHEPGRFRDYFLKGYSLFLSLVLPITFTCALFAEDITAVMLGPQWHQAAQVLRWLAPTIVAVGLIQPFSWVMLATGRATRAFKVALALAPVIILGYSIGLRWGALGVATGFSISMGLAVLPIIAWSKRDTLITGRDIFHSVARPLLSVLIAAGGTLLCEGMIREIGHAVPRLLIEVAILFSVYTFVLIFVLKQKAVYLGLLRDTRLWPFRNRRAEAAGSIL